MPTKSKNDDRLAEHGPPSISPSTVYSQPWWHSVGNSAMSSPAKHINGFAITGAQSQVSGDGPIKETHVTTAPESGIYSIYVCYENGHKLLYIMYFILNKILYVLLYLGKVSSVSIHC